MKAVRGLAWVLLLAVCLVAVFPDFFSPYSPTRQHRDLPYAAPGRYHDASLQWFVHGDPYRWLGAVPSSLRLFAAAEPGRIFLLGTDEFGRDWYSRLCHGASVTLLLAPAAALLSVAIALVLGTWAGFRGGWIDAVIMRGSEVFVVLPWFYVVIALRAALPLSLSGTAMLFVVFMAIAILGCATPARLFRGLTLALRTREFVLAARAAGANGSHTVRRHLLPFLLPAAWTQFLVGVPVYIVTEVTLSFLGLGAAEPTPTWGGMLVPLQQYVVLTSYPWMFAPAITVVGVCLALHAVASQGFGDTTTSDRK
jgi:peptide/nickel transport system permease protein